MNKKLKTTLLAWPAITLATIAICWLTGVVAEAMKTKIPPQQTIEIIRNLHGRVLVGYLALVLVAAPLWEETVFRWALWRLPTRLIRGNVALPAAVVSSVLFSAVHYIPKQVLFPDTAFVALFFFGFMQCMLYRKTESLWCPMLQHALFNLVNVALIFAFPSLSANP
jgi:membrane protease YdiL (CAAX protease family)